MMPVVYHPAALEELAEADQYLESHQTGLGQRLQNLIEQIEFEISANPETGFIHNYETRMRLVRKFPYGVIFKTYTDHVFVVAIAHLSRKPGYWHNRLSKTE